MLFKKDSKGKIRTWHINVVEGGYIQISGLKDGKKVTSFSECEAKNVGRSNETSVQEQAKIEVNSKWKKKLDEGYFKTIEEAENEKVILPMLAHSYDKHSSKIDWSGDVFVQPKLDGMRALVVFNNSGVSIISRKGKNIETMNHIKHSFLGTTMRYGIYDGELYAHGLSFQDNMKLIKKYRKGESEKVKFHVYDTVSPKSWKERIQRDMYDLERVKTIKINSEKELKENHVLFMSQGYEGTMIRHGDSGYELNKRSYSLLKYKDFLDETYEILDIVPMEKRPKQGVVICGGLSDYKTFKATPKMTHKEREELLLNKKDYIGKTAEVRFFEYTDEGVPRFPIFIGVRLDK